jgi:hypothetical protein
VADARDRAAPELVVIEHSGIQTRRIDLSRRFLEPAGYVHRQFG